MEKMDILKQSMYCFIIRKIQKKGGENEEFRPIPNTCKKILIAFFFFFCRDCFKFLNHKQMTSSYLINYCSYKLF